MHGGTVRQLRARVGLDAGYFSRLLRALQSEGLISSQRDLADGRVRRVSLTGEGIKEWAALDEKSRELATSLLEPLGDSQRTRLLSAMAEVERLLNATAVTIEPVDPFSDEAQHCIESYFDELRERFDEGFDPERTVSAKPEELTPPSGWFFGARLDGKIVACGVMKVHDGYGEIKRMWVHADSRGMGIAQRLLIALESQAAAAGLDIVRMDAHRNLVEARRLYLQSGYQEIPPYNDNPYAHHWFEKAGLLTTTAPSR